MIRQSSLPLLELQSYSIFIFTYNYYIQLEEIQKKVEELEQGTDDQEVEFIETVEDLSSLIIYAKCKYIKPWNWEEQKKTKVTQLLSFGELTAAKLCIESSRGILLANS